jgi:cytidylate kinase
MDFRVVCISRTVAAEGEAIGRLLAERLSFRYVDERIIERAAQLAQVDPKLVADVEHRRPLLQRLLEKLATAQDLVDPVTLATGLPLSLLAPGSGGYRETPEDLRLLIRAAIHEVAEAGRAVILAHAASMALAGTAGVLRVLVTASAETRARRLAEANGISAEEAASSIAASDRERRNYFKSFYKINEELPTHYDVVLNTDALTPEQAAATLLSVMRQAS